MKTDAAFAELFSHNPRWLGELTGIDFPDIAKAAPKKFKGVEREADLVLQPKVASKPHYVEIHDNPELVPEARKVLLDIFEHLLYQRFNKKTAKALQAMIAKLTPIKETRAGQDLIKEVMEEGMEKGMEIRQREIVLRMNAKGMTVEQIEDTTGISKEDILRHLAAE